jgi:hypothetical protein
MTWNTEYKQHLSVNTGSWERALVTRKVVDPRVSFVLLLFSKIQPRVSSFGAETTDMCNLLYRLKMISLSSNGASSIMSSSILGPC